MSSPNKGGPSASSQAAKECLFLSISWVFYVVSLKFGARWMQNATVPRAVCVGKVYVCVERWYKLARFIALEKNLPSDAM